MKTRGWHENKGNLLCSASTRAFNICVTLSTRSADKQIRSTSALFAAAARVFLRGFAGLIDVTDHLFSFRRRVGKGFAVSP